MEQYLKLCKDVLNNGIDKKDRTNTGTKSLFGYQMRFDLSKGFPLLTTKKIHFKSVVGELLWFISGSTNIKYLVDNDIRIWNEWPYEVFKKSSDFNKESITDFAKRIKEDDNFAKKYGNLGPVYGKQWRDFNGIDQLDNLLKELKTNPNSRRLIISAWNPSDIKDMLLPPCHAFIQFYVVNNKLSCQLYQRSADIFLGVPFNIASYSLLTHLIARHVGLEVGEFVHTLGDAHIYTNHIDQVKLQLTRLPKQLPTLILNPAITSIYDFKLEDINIESYDPHPLIKGSVAV